MILHSITFHNFRQFIGEQKIDFTPDKNDPNKNVTVIIGENFSGKTTFALAFIWCLYGNENSQSKIFDDSVLTHKISSQMPSESYEDAFVKIEFEDEDKIYTIKRSQKFFKTRTGDLINEPTSVSMLYRTQDGEIKNFDDDSAAIARAIQLILPYNLSYFIFFQGERNNIISNKNLKKDIETILKLDASRELIKHLYGNGQRHPSADSIIGEYLAGQIDINNPEAQNIKLSYERYNKELEHVRQLIIKNDEEIRKIQQKLEEADALRIQAAPSIEIRNRLGDLKKQKQLISDTLKESNKEFIKLLETESISLFVYPFLKEMREKLTQMNINDAGIQGLEASVINELLNRGRCLCETDLKEGTSARRNVEKYLKTVPPHSIGNIVRDLQDKINEYSDKAKQFVENFQKKNDKILELHNNLIECENKEDAITKQLKDVDKINIKSVLENLNSYKAQLDNLKERSISYITQQSEKESKIDEYKKRVEEIKVQSNTAQRYRKYYNYAVKLYEVIQKSLTEKTDEIRKQLEEECKKLFNAIYRGERIVRIDDKFNIHLLEGDETELAISEGTRTIMYFSYIGAIIKIAWSAIEHERNKGEINYIESGEKYPLVLDAAFSSTDTEHTKNIARELANTVPQLIFAVMQDDWDKAKQDVIDKISKVYIFTSAETNGRINDAETSIKLYNGEVL